MKIFSFHPSIDPVGSIRLYVLAEDYEDAKSVLSLYFSESELAESYAISKYADCFYLREMESNEAFNEGDLVFTKDFEFELKKA